MSGATQEVRIEPGSRLGAYRESNRPPIRRFTVWRPGDLRFSELREEGGRTVQSVLVTDQTGALYLLEYDMVSGPAGWQINGVTIRRSDDATA
jgi:hypothetical protein